MTAGPVFPSSGAEVPGDESWRVAAARDWDPVPGGRRSWPGRSDNPLSAAPAGWRDEVPPPGGVRGMRGLTACRCAGIRRRGGSRAGGPDREVTEPAGVSVFSSEEAGDTLGPGRILAELSEQAFDHGLAALSDDALVGLLRSSRRLVAWQDGIELAVVAEGMRGGWRRLRGRGRRGPASMCPRNSRWRWF